VERHVARRGVGAPALHRDGDERGAALQQLGLGLVQPPARPVAVEDHDAPDQRAVAGGHRHLDVAADGRDRLEAARVVRPAVGTADGKHPSGVAVPGVRGDADRHPAAQVLGEQQCHHLEGLVGRLVAGDHLQDARLVGELLLGLTPGGDVQDRPDVADDGPARVAQDRRPQLQPAVPPVGGPVARLVVALVQAAVDDRSEQLDGGGQLVGVDVVQEVGAQRLGHPEAGDLGPGVVQERPDARRVRLEHDLVEGVEDRAVADRPGGCRDGSAGPGGRCLRAVRRRLVGLPRDPALRGEDAGDVVVPGLRQLGGGHRSPAPVAPRPARACRPVPTTRAARWCRQVVRRGPAARPARPPAPAPAVTSPPGGRRRRRPGRPSWSAAARSRTGWRAAPRSSRRRPRSRRRPARGRRGWRR